MEMALQVDDAALLELAKAGFDPVFGARPLKRAIQQQIENPLAKAILEGKFGAKDTVRVGVIDGSLRFSRVADATAVRSRWRRCWPPRCCSSRRSRSGACIPEID